MTKDLSRIHSVLGNLFSVPGRQADWDRLAVSPQQLDFFHENGYCSGLRLLDDAQVAQLRAELADLTDPAYPGNRLFHEYHSNESKDPDTVLFHALGAWRIKPAFHDLLWNPAFLMPESQLLDGDV